jgi:hypothetical protein
MPEFGTASILPFSRDQDSEVRARRVSEYQVTTILIESIKNQERDRFQIFQSGMRAGKPRHIFSLSSPL